MEDNWEYIDTGLSPWDAYLKYVVKEKPERFTTAYNILMTIMRLQVEKPEYADGVPTHYLIRAIVPHQFKHETIAYRTLGNLVKYNVVAYRTEIMGNKKRTFYSLKDPIGSQMGPLFSRAISEQSDNPIWLNTIIERLLVQALAARQVLRRHGLIDEWVAECDAWVSVPVLESGYCYGQTDQDVGFLSESLSHTSPFRP